MNKPRRDYIAEIVERRSREPQSERWDMFLQRFRSFAPTYKHILTDTDVPDEIHIELLRYIPIVCVAWFQGYFRLVYRDLLDAGEPFLSNATRCADIRLNIEHLSAVISNKVSAGDFISHLLPVGSPDEIFSTLNKLLDHDLTDRVMSQILPGRNATIREDTPAILDSIKEAFRTRHIFCHEVAPIVDLDKSKARAFINYTFVFIGVTDSLISEAITNKSIRT